MPFMRNVLPDARPGRRRSAFCQNRSLMTATGDAPERRELLGRERASDGGTDAERGEVVVGHQLADHEVGAALDREVREEVRVAR